MKKVRILLWIGLGVVFLLITFFSSLVTFITDWWWFSDLGFTQIFLKTLGTKIVLGFLTMVFVFLFLSVNFILASSSSTPWFASLPKDLFGSPITLSDKIVKKLGIIISLILGFIFGLVSSTTWQEVLKFFNSTAFVGTDPVFGKNVSFYIFFLPVFSVWLKILQAVIILSLMGTTLIYFLRLGVNFWPFFLGSKSSPKQSLAERFHLAVLLALFLASLAVNSYLSLFNLLVKPGQLIFGAVFTEINLVIPLLYALTLTALLSVLAALYWAITKRVMPLLTTTSLYFLIWLVMVFVPPLFQKIIVAPSELAKETSYIKNNIAATRQAFGLDNVEEREIFSEKPLTASDLAANELTIKNVRLWDRNPLLSTLSQIQEIRTYYEFVSVDNDRYALDGQIRQIMLSPRELASESLPHKTWINEKLTFTHGYGLTASLVNRVTAEGLPVLLVKDLPPKEEAKELSVAWPQIYFGEITNDYVIVNTKTREFDYPKGEENIFASYQGKTGVKLNSFLRRLFFALRFSDLNLVLSTEITPESKILITRNIKERLNKIAPFLVFDSDPYVVVANGKIFWIADAYTASSFYPYSQPVIVNGQRINYIRNSVKAVLDAYDGTVSFYIADTNDPLIQTYAKIFPGMFSDLKNMPNGLKDHLRFPEDLFRLQAAVYSAYHMNNPQVFYNKEDQWEIPVIAQEDKNLRSAMAPRHIIMKLPDEEKEEYIFMLPFTPRGKDNLSAWMVARNDGKFYGKLLVYRFPKQKLVFGPNQVIARINQDAQISKEITLWDQRGSSVIPGPLLVIPIEESLIYVQPLYLKAENGKIPELKRVIVAYENKISMDETLEAALAKIFGTEAVSETKETQKTIVTPTIGQEDIIQAREVYERAIQAQKEGDWARYGEEIKRLGEILKKK